MRADQSILCGDCRSPLRRELASPDEPAAGDPESYCPRCGRSAVRAATCPRCGSQVCAACGSILESANDLGLG